MGFLQANDVRRLILECGTRRPGYGIPKDSPAGRGQFAARLEERRGAEGSVQTFDTTKPLRIDFKNRLSQGSGVFERRSAKLELVSGP